LIFFFLLICFFFVFFVFFFSNMLSSVRMLEVRDGVNEDDAAALRATGAATKRARREARMTLGERAQAAEASRRKSGKIAASEQVVTTGGANKEMSYVPASVARREADRERRDKESRDARKRPRRGVTDLKLAKLK
jgi:hypothetical protein